MIQTPTHVPTKDLVLCIEAPVPAGASSALCLDKQKMRVVWSSCCVWWDWRVCKLLGEEDSILCTPHYPNMTLFQHCPVWKHSLLWLCAIDHAQDESNHGARVPFLNLKFKNLLPNLVKYRIHLVHLSLQPPAGIRGP